MCVCAPAHTRKRPRAEPELGGGCVRTGWRPPQGAMWSAHRKPSFTLAALGKDH